jgi:hypothetical protein
MWVPNLGTSVRDPPGLACGDTEIKNLSINMKDIGVLGFWGNVRIEVFETDLLTYSDFAFRDAPGIVETWPSPPE